METKIPTNQPAPPPLLQPLQPRSEVPAPPPGQTPPPQPRYRVRKRYVALAVVAFLFWFCGVGIAGYFRLSSPTQALRSSVMDSVPGQWDKRFAFHLGSLTMGLVRWGSSFFSLPPEPRAALDALHGVEVGVYKLHSAPSNLNYSTMFTTADKSMTRRGWERIVGVLQGQQFVAVYVPHGVHTLERMGCCVVVLNERDLVVASGSGNWQPLFELATQHLQKNAPSPSPHLARR